MSSKPPPDDTLLAVSALFVILFAPVTSQYFIFLPWLRPLTPVSALVLGVFNILVGLLLANYAACYFTDPGKVSPGWEGVPGTSVNSLSPIPPQTRTPNNDTCPGTPTPTLSDTAGSFCPLCNMTRPPRAHHCKRCGCCVLRMDHHCKWLNTCIGYRNQAHFIRFLLYATLAASLCIALILARLTHLVHQAIRHTATAPPNAPHPEMVHVGEVLVMAGNLCVLVPVGSILGLLTYQQMYNLTQNLTTIEYVKLKDDAIGVYVPSNPYRLRHPTDNVRTVMGRDSPWWMWALYTLPPEGTGTWFEVDLEAE
ncbi:DHHC palmitoyltransferase-domain-containing protein [Powellomyces hirtus]|nr:DHHC palmitoyltransferase-domain-containing protein [Powellomyces hirtus]